MHVYPFLLLLCFFFWLLEFTTCFFLLNILAKWTHQIDTPLWTHQIDLPLWTRQIDPPLWTRQIDTPLWTRQIDPPLWTRQCIPHLEFPGRPWPAKKPHRSDSDVKERGGGGGQARPYRASQAGTLLFCPTCKWPTYARDLYIHNVSILNTEQAEESFQV